MTEKHNREVEIQVTAPNGVTWTRRPRATSTGAELLQALADLPGLYSDVSRQWNWREEGRRDQEHDRIWQIIREWDNGAPDREYTEEEAEALGQAELDKVDKRLAEDRKRRADLVAQSYDKDREHLRLNLLRTEAGTAFFTHVLAAPASPDQREDAERRIADRQAAADDLRHQLGDPEQIIDRHGYLPSERREMNLRSHMDCWRHPALCEWAKNDRRRFSALLAMPIPAPASMCSECEAPAKWHEYDLSLRLFHPPPPPGSTAEHLARLLPGWWERCPASTAYNIEHKWGGKHALPDFGYEQWRAMLPPMLRTIFTPARPKPKRKRQPTAKPLAVIPPGPISEVMAKLAEAQAKYPTAQVRRGRSDNWELWPP
ncbi:hypothetical protein ACFS2C_10000 [Prauserella oleivorans]|uniref:DUF3560 domain-containing protein n=1 Tax=Prauserella oleivorans TaxID=1478153 RepID=A0ABW5W6X3_9PSEU